MFLFCDKAATFSLFEEIVSIAQAVFFRLHKYGFSKSVRQTMLLMPGFGKKLASLKQLTSLEKAAAIKHRKRNI